MNNLRLFYVLALLLFASLCKADFDLANTYYAEKNYEKAYKEFLESAQYGDYDSQQNLGVMYFRGEYVPKNNITAYAWLTLATQNKTYSEKGLNLKVYNKLNDDEKQAADAEYKALFEKFGDPALQTKLAPTIAGQIEAVKNQRILKTISPSYPRDLSQAGVSGMVDITFTVDKNGITRDHNIFYSSDKLFSRAALNALRKFQYEPQLVNGKAVDVNGMKMRFNFTMDDAVYRNKKITEHINKQREKAIAGDGNDKLTFAYLLEAIPSFAKDYKLVDNPNEWYTSAANQGSNAASYFLGRNILYGNMCTANSTQSMGWLLKAAKGGISDAQYMLAIESFSGARFEKNDEKGFYWLSKAANTNSFAKVRYAWMLSTHTDSKYRNGKLAQEILKGVDKNHVDKQSLFQALAAAAAETNQFGQAIKWQKEALEDAQNLEIPVQHLELQLNSYLNNSPWRESI